MILKRYAGISFLAVGVVLGVVLTLIGTGCTKSAPTGPTPLPGGNAGGPAPVAKPGAPIGANNPPAGQPNHMSPEMQAQLQHYQSMGQNNPNKQ